MNIKKRHITLPLVLVLGLLLAVGGFVLAAPQVTKIEVNQAIGLQKDGHQYYVAGKSTVVRAFLSEPTVIDLSRTSVKVFLDEKWAFNIPPVSKTGAVSAVDFRCSNLQACGNWAAGTYTFQVSVNDDLTKPTGSYVFQTGAPIRILAVAVKANYGTEGIKSVADDTWKGMSKFMQNVYPLADGNLKWTVRTTELDASAKGFNLEKSDWTGCDKLSSTLAGLIPAHCEVDSQADGCFDYVVGFVKESWTMDDDKTTLVGFAYTGSQAVVAVAGDDDAPGTIAHEIAHQFGIGDTYDDAALSSIRCTVNPAPNGFKGRNWDDNLKSVTSCTAGRPASTLKGKDGKTIISGAQVPEANHPYEAGGRGALPEMADFMSAGGALQKQLWITPDTYDWLFRRIVVQEPQLRRMLRIVNAAVPPQMFLRFSGVLSKTGAVELAPWKSFTQSAALSDTAGPLMVQAVDGTGAVVASTAFTAQFFMVHPPRDLDRAPFKGVIRFPADTAKFQVVQNGAVLAEVPVSTNAPTVSNVTPTAPTTLSGPYTITWTATDPDPGSLTCTVEYNPDVTNPASAWMVLADDLTGISWNEDFSFLPGGGHAKIRVTASDGTQTASAESAEFIVAKKKPEVFVDDPPWGTTYQKGDSVLLTAQAFDAQDERLADTQLKWSSNISGTLGYGPELLVSNLAPGVHLVTFTATNSAGLSASDTVTVQVNDPAGGGKSGPCFIATAAFGSSLAPAVELLRDFRDAFLLTNGAGRAFVAWYYRVSPPLAELVAGNVALRAAARALLLPVIGFGALALQIGLLWGLILTFAILALAGTGIFRLERAVRRRR